MPRFAHITMISDWMTSLRRLFLLLLCAGVLAGCTSTTDSSTDADTESEAASPLDRAAEVEALRQVLQDQQAAWNRGDLEAFMAGYAKTDTLRFASGGNVRTGWQETLDSYRRGYPDRAAMGTLTFDQLDVEVMSATWAMIFGQWALERKGDRPSGLFTLIANRPTADAEWRIVHDHTSSTALPEDTEDEREE
jgi:ketosteroid isomerase-like protein